VRHFGADTFTQRPSIGPSCPSPAVPACSLPSSTQAVRDASALLLTPGACNHTTLQVWMLRLLWPQQPLFLPRRRGQNEGKTGTRGHPGIVVHRPRRRHQLLPTTPPPPALSLSLFSWNPPLMLRYRVPSTQPRHSGSSSSGCRSRRSSPPAHRHRCLQSVPRRVRAACAIPPSLTCSPMV
jgi:hypothetical protein